MFGTEWKLKQPNGEFVDVRIFGDEYYQDVETPDGYTLIRDPVTGIICYASVSTDGNEYVSTGVPVGAADPVSLGLQPHLRINPAVRSAKAKEMRDLAYAPEREKLNGREITALAGPPDNGNVLGLCLLADFSDQVATIPQGDVVNFCNQVGYSQNGNNGSVRDYFFDVSDGNLTYTHYVSPAYYRPANTFAWYDDCAEPWLDRGIQLIVEILNDMEADGFDFSAYDSNGDNFIDAVNLFYAGNTACGWAKGMWPGSGSMGGFAADGVSVNRFQITGMGGMLTIGTYCHENGHMICYYPDLYDYDDDSNGVGDYCLMASGGPSTNPTEVCAPLKVNSGWATVNALGAKATGLSLPAGTNTYYQYTRGFNPLFPGENFLIENRQKTARDAALPDAGLTIWHVEEVWGNHNNQQMTIFSHFPYTVMQADGDWDLENDVNNGDSGDLYSSPGSTALTPCTDPNTNWWDGTASGFSVTNVSAIGANMTFDFSPDDDDPVAQTQAYAADADEDCCIFVSVSDIDNGSYDPDGPGDIESLCITAVDGNAVGCQQTVQICGDGNHTVTLTVTDLCGNTDSEVANVQVVNSPPVAVAQNFSANADDNCCIVVNLSDIDGGTNDPDGFADIETFCITAVDGSDVGCEEQVIVCGNGSHTVTITATDFCGYSSSADATVDVIDITPPEITVELNRDVLWPPNHKMVEICATSVEVTDNCDPNPEWVLESITSDEPDNGQGDGNTTNDIQDADYETDDLCFDLRSERQGGGDGRKYTIVYRAFDDSGNEAWFTICVRVPHDQSGNAMSSSGFIADGSALAPATDHFAFIIPAVEGVNAGSIERAQILLGNSSGAVRPEEVRVVQYDADNRPDLAVFFTAQQALNLIGAAKPVDFGGRDEQVLGREVNKTESLGLHFTSPAGVDYLVSDVFALGAPVPMPDPAFKDPPLPQALPEVATARETALRSIHPNPFNPQTTVAISLASPGLVRIAIYDVRGSLVRRLADDVMPAGDHSIVWNGVDDAGRPATSGIYFVRMIAGRYTETKKIVMLK
jgi:M6 family metalloprotease-like protein